MSLAPLLCVTRSQKNKWIDHSRLIKALPILSKKVTQSTVQPFTDSCCFARLRIFHTFTEFRHPCLTQMVTQVTPLSGSRCSANNPHHRLVTSVLNKARIKKRRNNNLKFWTPGRKPETPSYCASHSRASASPKSRPGKAQQNQVTRHVEKWTSKSLSKPGMHWLSVLSYAFILHIRNPARQQR